MPPHAQRAQPRTQAADQHAFRCMRLCSQRACMRAVCVCCACICVCVCVQVCVQGGKGACLYVCAYKHITHTRMRCVCMCGHVYVVCTYMKSHVRICAKRGLARRRCQCAAASKETCDLVGPTPWVYGKQPLAVKRNNHGQSSTLSHAEAPSKGSIRPLLSWLKLPLHATPSVLLHTNNSVHVHGACPRAQTYSCCQADTNSHIDAPLHAHSVALLRSRACAQAKKRTHMQMSAMRALTRARTHARARAGGLEQGRV